MRIVSMSELRARMSEYIRLVKEGEEVLVTERGKPVARIVPVGDAERIELAQQGRRGS